MQLQKGKQKFGLLILVLSLITCLNLVIAQPISPGSVDFQNIATNNFLTNEEVYFSSNTVCARNKDVDLYIVEDKSQWLDNEELIDVRGTPQSVQTDSNAKISLIKIWEDPIVGKYDIILDCDNNGEYTADPILEPIDSSTSTGFFVNQAPGLILVSKGFSSIGDHTWQYDPESLDFVTNMLQFSVTAQEEDIMIDSIVLNASGDGNDLHIANVLLYEDLNKNGRVDSVDKKISEGAFDKDNGVLELSLSYEINELKETSFIVVYSMKKEARSDFYIEVLKVSGIGIDSGKRVGSEDIVKSNVLNVIEPKTCLGFINANFIKDSVNRFETLSINLRNISGCTGKQIKVQTNNCSSDSGLKCSCLSGDDGCRCNIKAGAETQTYFVCIDKNNDNDYLDLGETTTTQLIVLGDNQDSEVNSSSDDTQGDLTGGVISDDQEPLIIPGNSDSSNQEVNSFNILLEVTLLLILVMLFLILISLNKRSQDSSSNSKSNKKEKKEIKDSEED